LHARKGITSGEGGVFVSDDERLLARARKLSCFGVESAYSRESSDDLPVQTFDELGYNYKLSDILAAIALVQLDREPALLTARRLIAERYQDGLDDVAGLTLPRTADDRDHAWQTYALTLAPECSRDAVARELRSNGVQVSIGTFASHLQPVYQTTRACPTSAELFRRQLAIPMHPGLSDDDIDFVADMIRKAVSRSLG
jgi:dTDP-4-amino-4,6-dideoxygalactose transaminase